MLLKYSILSTKTFTGVVFFITSLLIGIANDSITKHLGKSMNINQLVFMRFSFSIITLMPFIFITGIKKLKTTNLMLHITRGLLLFIAISLWSSSFQHLPLTTVTVISFTMPLYILFLSAIFLKEIIKINRLLATVLGFIGILLVINPESTRAYSALTFLLLASVCFATLDIINKKYVSTEPPLSVMFYSALITTLLGGLNVYSDLEALKYSEILLLFILGSGTNLTLYFLLQAFKHADASFLSPFRYLELVFSFLAGYFLFNEHISLKMFIGCGAIVMSLIWVTYYEHLSDRGNTPIKEA